MNLFCQNKSLVPTLAGCRKLGGIGHKLAVEIIFTFGQKKRCVCDQMTVRHRYILHLPYINAWTQKWTSVNMGDGVPRKMTDRHSFNPWTLITITLRLLCWTGWRGIDT